MNLGALIPLIAMLIIVFVAGLWASRHVRSSGSFLEEYFLGDRSLGRRTWGCLFQRIRLGITRDDSSRYWIFCVNGIREKVRHCFKKI